MTSHLVRAGVLAAICATSVTTVANARTPFDGPWSVLIVTESGGCDRAYRYGIQIVDGQVIYRGGGANFSGQVARNGAVRVTVSASSGVANGAGKLGRDFGEGTWSGRSSSGACAGYWEATRR